MGKSSKSNDGAAAAVAEHHHDNKNTGSAVAATLPEAAAKDAAVAVAAVNTNESAVTKVRIEDAVNVAVSESGYAKAAVADGGDEDPDTAAAAAAADSATADAEPLFPGDPAAGNKWAKNGFGAPVSKQSGKFSKDETELVRAAIEDYCTTKQITVARLCSECDHKSDTKGAWMEIAKRLPHRSVQSVYRHGIRQCHPFKRGAWSEQECNTLTDLVQRMGKKWSTIQAKLNRSADSCRDKYREMSDDYTKGRWRDEETELLQKLIRDHLNADAGVDMRELGVKVEKQNIQIPWSTISKRMGKRSRLSCFKKWQKMTGLMSPSDVYLHKRARSDETDGGDEVADRKGKPRPPQRVKSEETDGTSEDAAGAAAPDPKVYADAPTAGAAAAIAAGRADYDIYSAKMAAETVEAVELPDTDTLVREI